MLGLILGWILRAIFGGDANFEVEVLRHSRLCSTTEPTPRQPWRHQYPRQSRFLGIKFTKRRGRDK